MSTTPTRHARLSSPRVGKCSTGPRSASASCGNRTRCSVKCLFSASSSACIAALPPAFRRKQYQAPSAEGRIVGLVPDGKRETIFAALANAPGNPIACIPGTYSCRLSTGGASHFLWKRASPRFRASLGFCGSKGARTAGCIVASSRWRPAGRPRRWRRSARLWRRMPFWSSTRRFRYPPCTRSLGPFRVAFSQSTGQRIRDS